jgi:phosphatidylinositol alpha-1,6-mannosyltransferase
MKRLLLVTNDFPPKVGGIQTYLWELYRRIAATGVDVTVLAPEDPGSAAFDARAPFEIVRRGQLIWPTPGLERDIARLAEDADAIIVGSTLPMLASVNRVGKPVVAHTYGLELAGAKLPLARQALRRVLAPAVLTTAISEFTARSLRPVTNGAVSRVRTGVDLSRFDHTLDGARFRGRYGLGARPVVVFVSRLVPRKGADQLIRVLPDVRARIPDAALLIVGDGPDRRRLEQLAAAQTLPANAIVFTGGVPTEELPLAYAAGDVFAMPCRSRTLGLEVEGLGLVYLEAQAMARPVITGDSGGAPEAIIDGVTGITVGGRDRAALRDAIERLLVDRSAGRAMGLRGRDFVREAYDWDRIAREHHADIESRLPALR